MNSKKLDMLIIGGGPAGLAAAIKAKESGIDNLMVIERSEELGGLLHQCIHNGFGLHYFKEDLTGPEYALKFINKVDKLGINYLLKTMVLDITPDKNVFAINSENGLIKFSPKTIVLAMGCRERTRYNILIPGTRPAGIFTAGNAQRLINVEGYIPGDQVVILGSGDIGMIMARRLTLEGAEVKAVVEILPYIGGLIRNEVQCLNDFNIPTFLEHTVTEVYGSDRIEGVEINRIDKNGKKTLSTGRYIKCNTLLLSVGLIPENELSIKAGVEIDQVTGGPIIDENMQTNVPGIFAGGNVVHVLDLADNVSLESEIAGLSASKYLSGELHRSHKKIKVSAGKGIRYVVPHYISGKEGINLYMRVSNPEENATLKITDKFNNKIIYEKKFQALKPSEMVCTMITEDNINLINNESGEIIISCNKKE
ncbi:MAG: FAD-dependent oxidoreductase [Actinomycetota bacterium]|nr:FAD-dependent oxidoreductase [Actinomycetota bacterium]